MLSEIVTTLFALISVLWLYYEPGFEPLIALLTALGAISRQVYLRYNEGSFDTLFGAVMLPLVKWKEKNSPVESIIFNNLVRIRSNRAP